MSLIQIVRNVRKVLKPNLYEAMYPRPMSLMSWMRSYKKGKSPKELVERYKDWAFICINKIATAVASVDLKLYVTNSQGKIKGNEIFETRTLDDKQRLNLYKRNGNGNRLACRKAQTAPEVIEILEHPFLDLWNTVNQFKNGFETTESIIQFLELLGNAYIYMPQDNKGLPISLWIIPAQGMTIVPSKENFIQGYLYVGSNGLKIPFEPTEIIHFSYPNPKDRWKGMGTLEGILTAIDQHTAMSDFQEAIFRNRGIPEGILSFPPEAGTINEDKMKELRREWNRLYGGISQQGKIAIMSGGMEFKELTFKPKDLQYPEGRRLTRDEACAGFGVPKSKVTMEDVNRANSESGDYQFMKDTVYPRCIRIEQKLNEVLIPLYGDRFFVAYDNPVPADKLFELKENAEYLKNKVLSPNEVRARSLGLPPREGGDEYTGSATGGAVPFKNSPQQIGITDSYFISSKERAGGVLSGAPPANLVEKRLDKETSEILAFLRKYYRKQLRAVLGKLRDMPKSHKDISLELRLLEDIDAWIDELKNGVEKPLSAILINGINHGADEIHIDVAWDVSNTEAAKWLETYNYKFAHKVVGSTEKDLRGLVQHAIREGWDEKQLGVQIREKYGFYQQYKSEMIARTEKTRAMNAGRTEAWKQSGFVTGKQWLTAPGACDYCAPLDGKVISLERHFFSEGETAQSANEDDAPMQITYEDVDSPPLHPWCRCTTVAFMEEIPQE